MLIDEIKEHVTKLYNQYKGDDLCYHNLEHTEAVVKRAIDIAANYSLSETELFILQSGAWFHDTGHLEGSPQFHEDRSVILMKEFMGAKGVDKELIHKTESCICATKLPQRPKNLVEEIMCDADTFHLGTKDFLKTDERLKKEYTLRNIPVDNWEEKTLELLFNHTYFSEICKALLQQGKEENIEMVRNLIKSKKNTKEQ